MADDYQRWLETEFAAACEDAGVSGRLFTLSGKSSPSGEDAMLTPRGRTVPRRFFRPEELEVKDEVDGDLQDHRVLVRSGDHPVLVAAKIRHELEHARQFEAHGDAVIEVEQTFLFPVLSRRFVGPGAARLYNLLPSEMDANAAASVFVRRRHEMEVADLSARDPVNGCPLLLLSRSGPEPVETLPFRTVAYAFMFRQLLDDWANDEHGCSFGEAIDVFLRGAAEMWRSHSPDGSSIVAVPTRP